ncbi:MAG TPA: DegQ family serine endoprotease [bacterium]|nr:DegQ family serine endoprotease [bacterium]HOM26786.1 DegQ family serine endoprotease [bacterium]
MKKNIMIGFIFGLIFSGLVFTGYSAIEKKTESKKFYSGIITPTSLDEPLTLQSAFVQVAKSVKPAVVQITTEKIVTYRYWDPFGDLDEFFRSPFEEFFGTPRRRQQPKTYQKKQEGLGSGFIVDEDGYILTNNHVIEGVDKILVKLLGDERKYEAKVIGTDPKTDLALIKINAGKPLPYVKLGDSDKIEVGEWVIAIGNPFGLEETVTVGVVSAKGRSGFGITQYEDFIQTDAAINPGNSGGPLVNIRGEVIGINTFIIAPYVAQGVGFAIPINLAKKVFTQLKEKGKVTRGYLGVYLQALDEELAKSFGLSEIKGALVAQVLKDSPAEKGGIKDGDVIIEYDGTEVKDVKDLQMKVANTPVGKRVSVGIWRDKKKIVLNVTVGEMPAEEPVAAETEEKLWRGMRVSALTEEMKSQFGIDENEGVVVTYVETGSPADESGIKVGSVIKMINDYKISNISDYRKVIKNIPKNTDVRVQIKFGDRTRFLVLKGEK